MQTDYPENCLLSTIVPIFSLRKENGLSLSPYWVVKNIVIFVKNLLAIPNTPKISVILPFFNAEETLDQAIQSIRNQTFEAFECIVINNNSTDTSLSIAEKHQNADPRIKLIHEANQGVAHASNTGFKASQGTFVARMDADDEAYSTRLEQQLHFLQNNPGYGAVGGLAEYSSNKPFTGFKTYVSWVNSVRSHREIIRKQFIDSPIVNPTAMWRRTTAEKHGLYKDGDFPEDYEMWLRWLYQGVKIAKIPEFVLKWNDSATRLTRTHAIYSDEAFYNIKTRYLSYWLESNNPFYPHVMIWGASKISRKRAELLEQYGIVIDGYIDINPARQINKPLYHYTELKPGEEHFILIYVRQWHAKKAIEEFLTQNNYREGTHFLFIS